MNGLLARALGVAYETPLSPTQEVAFQEWKQQHAPQDSGFDYDFRGAFLAGASPDRESGHWVDTFKKPNHPTFSDESKYAIPFVAGSWEGEQFQPSMIQQYLGDVLTGE